MWHHFGLVLFAVLHGYFAAWLAVWMLFYPRAPKFIGKFHIPFTPGLLPSSRGTFERAIADAVSAKLLKPEILEEAAKKQGLPKLIRTALPDHIEDLAEDREFMDLLVQGVSQAVKDFLHSKQGLKSDIEGTAMVPFTKSIGFSFDNIFNMIWRVIDEAVDKACRSEKSRSSIQKAIRSFAGDMRKDDHKVSMKVEEMAGKMVGTAVGALDVKTIVFERLSSFSDEELEKLVHQAAGRELQSIKNLAAVIGILFGVLSAFIFR